MVGFVCSFAHAHNSGSQNNRPQIFTSVESKIKVEQKYIVNSSSWVTVFIAHNGKLASK